MRFIFFYFLMLIAPCVYAQPDSNYVPYTFPDRVPDSYNLNSKEEYDKIVSQKIRGASAKELALYAEEIVYQHKSLIDNAKIYFNWYEAEDYLNRVLQTLLDDSLKGGEKTHVYLTRIADKNAFTFNDGNIYFNIGLLAEVKDESSIAIILGHELSHYLNSDYLHTFINHLKTAQ